MKPKLASPISSFPLPFSNSQYPTATSAFDTPFLVTRSNPSASQVPQLPNHSPFSPSHPTKPLSFAFHRAFHFGSSPSQPTLGAPSKSPPLRSRPSKSPPHSHFPVIQTHPFSPSQAPTLQPSFESTFHPQPRVHPSSHAAVKFLISQPLTHSNNFETPFSHLDVTEHGVSTQPQTGHPQNGLSSHDPVQRRQFPHLPAIQYLLVNHDV